MKNSMIRASAQEVTMSLLNETEAYEDADNAPLRLFPWLTPRRAVFFVIGWIVMFALMSAFVSSPFMTEPNASVPPSTFPTMYLHGLLVSVSALGVLLASHVLCLRATHVQVWVTGGVLAAAILAGIGGLWIHKIPGAEAPMWLQIFGFFALDEILLVLLVGIVSEWLDRSSIGRTLPLAAAGCATFAMFIAAVMGHLNGWILEFGDVPGVIGEYAHAVGFASLGDFSAALLGSHSHEMAVGIMGMAIALAAQQFGYTRLRGAPRAIAGFGLTLVAVGAIAMTALYVAMGFTTYQPPNLFASGPGGVNAIAGDDITTGLSVMLGGVLVVAGLAMGRLLNRSGRLAAAWAWVASFLAVVVSGYYIEMHEVYFGAGSPAPGAAKDAVFTWLHQDIGLFLMPALVLVMLAVEGLVRQERPNWIGWTIIIGISIILVGGGIWVFVNPALYGLGFGVSTVGLLVVGAGLLVTLWWAIQSGTGRVETVKKTLPA
jgi:hypothetical protein